ncbi:MAG: alpha/beta fold hydrolase [Polyangiaceae bacterium]
MNSVRELFLRLGLGLGFGLLLCLEAGCMSFHQGPMPGEPKNAEFANVEGVRVRYADTGGDKPAVVLIHGFASSLDAWATVVPELAKTHRVLALDLKGFGWTDRPEGDYSPDAEAQLVLALMSQRNIQSADLVAHSWGASVALAAAMRAPDRVRRLALYDAWVYEAQLPATFHWSRTDGVGEMLFGLYYKQRADEKMALAFYDQKYVTEELVDAVEDALDRPGTVAAALAAVRGQRFAGVEANYRNIQQKTLLLWGREDAVATLDFGERLVRDLPNAHLVVYPHCGHFPMIEARTESNRDLIAFLGDAPAQATLSEAPTSKTSEAAP